MPVAHVFDLPKISSCPSSDTLLSILHSLRLPKLKNFDPEPPLEIPGLFDWLTTVIGSDLAWIEEEYRDEVWHECSQSISERCGRTAAPTRIREMDILGLQGDDETITVDLIEPTLTNDALGLKTWGSAYVFANRLRKHSSMLFADCSKDNTCLLELGCGTGLCGIVLGKLGFKAVITDLPEIVRNANDNLELNKVQDLVTATSLDWTKPSDFRFKDSKYTHILVSDPIYSPEHPKLVVDTINQYRDSACTVLVQLPLREKYDNERALFKHLMEEANFTAIFSEKEDGRDDWGDSRYLFTCWKSNESL